MDLLQSHVHPGWPRPYLFEQGLSIRVLEIVLIAEALFEVNNFILNIYQELSNNRKALLKYSTLLLTNYRQT